MSAHEPANVYDASDADRKIEILLRRFAGGDRELELDFRGREAALLDIFDHCGFSARRGVRLRHERGLLEVDGEFDASIDGEQQRIAIEIKSTARPKNIASAIEQAKRIRLAGRYDRALIIVAGDIPEGIRRRAENDGIGYIDLLGIPDLRSWLWKYSPTLQPDCKPVERTCAQIIREAMRAIAERLVRVPDEISTIDWRDMERVLREVFEGMGFDTALTRSGKDGGFDLELMTEAPNGREVYLIEVKHWTDQKPGKTNLRKLVRVTAKQRATLGILLSSSGFAPSIYEGFTEAERRTVALGGRDKIIGLCTTYYRLGQQLWTPGSSISTQLLEGLL